MENFRPILGVTMGDASGAGPEIVVKALTQPHVRALCRPIVIGDILTFRQAAGILASDVPFRVIDCVTDANFDESVIEVLDLHNIDLKKLDYGKVQPMTGQAAYECIVKAVELALDREIEAIVTSAIHKESLNMAEHHFPGHTEILAHLCEVKSFAMLLIAGNFRVSHVSTHVSLREAIERVKKNRILEVTRLTNEAVIRMGIKSPRLAVAGLNPHAGEGSLFGNEEELEIRPAVEAARTLGINLTGPIPPDTVFFRMKEGEFDAVVAMFHDQGHIPTKVIAFDKGVNVTLGLPIIRTSVDHGTVFDKAGKGTARPDSMIEALKLAAKLASTSQ